MGLQQSKDETLYQQVLYGNIDGIKALHREGVGLEYKDREGKTALMVACLNPSLYNVAKTLIELGANVNAYRPGRNGGTPLHHAAKRGLDNVVVLLLSHGANALLINDDCQTPLDNARAKGYTNVVRAIESHICLYSGWLRELYGPGFLEIFAPQLLSRKVWVVVVPCGSRSLRKPFKLELVIYINIQDAQPRTTIALWRANMEEPAFNQPDPAVILSDASTISKHRRKRSCRPRRVSQTRIKLAAPEESDKQQLQQFCNACKGIPQVMHSNFPFNTATPVRPSIAPPPAMEVPPPISVISASPDSKEEDAELAMAINASIQTAMEEGIPLNNVHEPDGASSSSTVNHSVSSNSQTDPPSKKASCSDQLVEEGETSATSTVAPTNAAPTPMPIPSAPTLSDDVLTDGPISYPTIDSDMFDSVTLGSTERHGNDGDGSKRAESSSCVICFDAPVEGACVPCGHMAGCMSCLNEIKAKKWGCPVCRTNIDQVIKVFAV